jgi:hypothetical protein
MDHRTWKNAMKGAVIAAGLLGMMTAWADGGRSLESYDQHHGAFRGDRGGDEGHEHHGGRVSGVPEPSEWVFMGIGLALIAAVAHRRQASK